MESTQWGNASLESEATPNVVERKGLQKDGGDAWAMHARKSAGLDGPTGEHCLDRGFPRKFDNLRDGSLSGRLAARLGSD